MNQMITDDDLIEVPPFMEISGGDEDLQGRLVHALKSVYDPEIPVDIYELGLIYRLDIADDGSIHVDMSLTAPGCPVAGEMPGMVETALSPVEGVTEVSVEIVWDPPWNPGMMTDHAKVALDFF